ncbi:MAG: hypothetical protein KGI50_06445 [Patescibacteria group bacterium]|nr:hypothetical protein [Patescibacteria group bacterium]MDE2439186.1 hypothetical protein [Patescibacteria group bacterium]
MPRQTDITQPNVTWSLMDRLMSVNNVPLVQSDVSTASYTVTDISNPTNPTVVVSGLFTIPAIIFNTLQTLGWDTTKDPLGYNLRIDWPIGQVPQAYNLIYQYVVVLILQDGSSKTISHTRETLDEPTVQPYYGSVQGGDVYFARKYGRDAWKEAEDDDKVAVLTEATQHIEQLNYFGRKTSCTQTMQFPRGGDTSVPLAIQYATYEEAYQILLGRDVDEDARNRTVQQRKFGPVSTTYLLDARQPANVGAGILSTIAWRFLIPYLRRAEDITLVRIS